MSNIVEATLLALQGKLDENLSAIKPVVAEVKEQPKIEETVEPNKEDVKIDTSKRADDLRMMDRVARRVNDEDVFEYWLMVGVPDGAEDWEFDEWAKSDEDYLEFEKAFKKLMKAALDDGLYNADEEEYEFAKKYEPEIKNLPKYKIPEEKVEESTTINDEEDYNEIAQEYKEAYHKDLDMKTVPCVIARDKMLSGWGGASGRTHYQVVLCGNMDEAYNIEDTMQGVAKREQLSNIRRAVGVKLSSNASIAYAVGRNASAWNRLSDNWYEKEFGVETPVEAPAEINEEPKVEEVVERRCLGQKVEETKEIKTESAEDRFADYIVLKDYNHENWCKILLFDHYLTNGDISRIEQAVNNIKEVVEDYTNEEIEEAIDEVVPYIDEISLYGDDKTIYF